MKAVNLLPADRHHANATQSGLSRLPSRLLIPAGGVLMLATVVGLVFAVVDTNSNVNSKQAQLGAIQTKIAKLPAAPAPVAATTGPSRRTTLAALAGDRLPWDGFLGAFARVVPEDVWLSSLQANAPGAAATVVASQAAAAASLSASSTTSTTSTTQPATPAVASIPSNFTITGYTYSQPSVARLMRRLTLVPWLSDVALVSSVKANIGTATVYQFTVGASVLQQPRGA